MAARGTPRVLVVAGSDSSGHAGLQADLRTLEAHGCVGSSAVTAVTAQGGGGVVAIHLVPAELVQAQIERAFADAPVDAVKVGMLGCAATIEAVARALSANPGPPIVVDPVLAASSGERLLADDAVAVLLDLLVPLATVLTPNLPEAERLAAMPVRTEAERLAAARSLGGGHRGAVLLKGGHDEGDDLVDLFVVGERVERFVHPRLAPSLRGTGCTLSTAIAARLAAGESLAAAVRGGIDFLQGLFRAATSR